MTRLDETRERLVERFRASQAKGDVATMVETALLLPTVQRFGAAAGQLPALLYEAYRAADEPLSRARLAAALARAWVYGGDAEHARRFAREAETLAVEAADPAVLAEALDAALASRWGPDDFAARPSLAARLAEAAAHLTDERTRLAANLWRLTTAWECLDVVGVLRQLRELDLLADETGSKRVAFFAVSRRAMYSLVRGELAQADELIARADRVGATLAEPDVAAVLHSLSADRAKQAADAAALAREAAAFEAYGAAEGIPSVLAEAAVLWLAAGNDAAAERLVRQLSAAGFAGLPRDVDFLLTVASTVAVASQVGLDDVAAAAGQLLEPYAGRAVLNAGAVAFHGVVDDYLYRAHPGDPAADHWRHSALLAYRRLGAVWWEHALGDGRPALHTAEVLHLHPEPGGGWLVGPAGATVLLPNLKGLHYLRYLLQRPGGAITATDLSEAVNGSGLAHQTDLGTVIDRAALADYRQRLTEIEQELSQAQSWADSGRIDLLESEREALLDEIRAATGLGNRLRRSGGGDERARIAVRKAIAATFRRIEHDLPGVGRLLRDTVRTGSACHYEPDPNRTVHWRLERS